jgi:hypothetical protein
MIDARYRPLAPALSDSLGVPVSCHQVDSWGPMTVTAREPSATIEVTLLGQPGGRMTLTDIGAWVGERPVGLDDIPWGERFVGALCEELSNLGLDVG